MEHIHQPVQPKSFTAPSSEAFALPSDAAVSLRGVADASRARRSLLLDGDEVTAPLSEGACQLDMTVEEWRLLRGAPVVGFLMVAGADGHVSASERRALFQALEEGKRSPSEAFQAVCRELFRERDTLMAEFISTSALGCEPLSQACRLVRQKLGPEEAERFKTCLLKLGQQVASASDGLLSSLGWRRPVERRALAELAMALDPSYT